MSTIHNTVIKILLILYLSLKAILEEAILEELKCLVSLSDLI